ncbi:hypothetical protein ACTHO0_19435 [Cytobacillus praedii]|uniref:hypothetical protein n=1 Tax=Cytobacillus praedii TaxID=1742358 RepID=UPI003F80FA8B
MRSIGLLMIFIILSLLMGCSNQQTFEEFFHKEMKENEKEYTKDVNYSYSLVHQEQNIVQEEDAIAIFKENNHQGKQIFIAYFKKENGKWYWEQTRGAEWDTPHKWSAMHEIPYIYSGAISDNSINEIYAGREKAKIIDVEGNKRFWFAISPSKEVQVKLVRKNGTEEIVESIDEEMLKEWGK